MKITLAKNVCERKSAEKREKIRGPNGKVFIEWARCHRKPAVRLSGVFHKYRDIGLGDFAGRPKRRGRDAGHRNRGATPLAAQKPRPLLKDASPRRGVNSSGRPASPASSLLVRHNGPHCSSSRLEPGRIRASFATVFVKHSTRAGPAFSQRASNDVWGSSRTRPAYSPPRFSSRRSKDENSARESDGAD